MALCRFNRTVHKRNPLGGSPSSAARVQYLLREGAYAPAEVRVAHLDREPGGEMVRDDLIVAGMRNMPVWARADAALFFTMAERHEAQHNSVISTEWKITLPRELAREAQLQAAQDFMRSQLGDTHPYVWAMHEPLAHDGKPQPHVHCLWSSRTLDGVERDAVQFFHRYNREHPERGGAKKEWDLIRFGQAKRERIAYTDVMNAYLERAGQWERLHPDSLKERGFTREAEPRALPSDSNKAKYRGEITDAWRDVLEHRGGRQQYDAEEQVQARQYWDARKQALGWEDMATVDHEVLVARVAAQGRAPYQSKPTLEVLQEEEIQLRTEAQQATRALRSVEAQIMVAEGREHARRHGVPVQRREPERTRQVVQGVVMEDEEMGGLMAPDLHKKRGRDGIDF